MDYLFQEWNTSARDLVLQLKCEKCKKVFTRSKDLRFHEKNCKECNCIVCGKTFKDTILLKKHVKIHNPEDTRTCDICNKTFCSRQALGRHKESVHSKNNSFACNTCEKLFSTKGSLNRHNKNIHQ